MKKIKFEYNDYGSGVSESLKLGVHFYDSQILFGWNDNLGTRTYHFRVQLIDLNQHDRIDVILRKKQNDAELIDFLYTCDLKDFTKVLPAYPDFDIPERLDLDWDKLIKIAAPKQLKKAKQRLTRKIRGKVPKPVIYTTSETAWHVGDEFLWFSDETAYSWAGPFRMGKKQGAAVQAKENIHKDLKYPVFDVAKYHTRYNLPHAIYEKVDDATHYHMTPDEKEAFFNTLSVTDKHHTAKNYYSMGYLKESLAQCLPYRIYMCGNDDCSYSKWFATKKEMDDEMKYLRKMQPLDFYIDIRDRGYIFTN